MIDWFDAHLVDIVDGLAAGSLLFVLGVGLSLIFGIMNVLNLAHGSLYLAGACVAWKLSEHGATWPRFLLGLVLAAFVGLLGGALLAAMSQSLAGRGHLDQALLTLGVAIVLAEGLAAVFGDDPRTINVPRPLDRSTELLGHSYPVDRLAVLAIGIVLAIGVHAFVERSRFGALARATAGDREMVAALGVDTRRVIVAVFAVGCGLAALAGALGGRITGASRGVETRVLLLAVVVVVIGGLGSVIGTFVAALLIGQVQALGPALVSDQVVPFLLFVAMALVLIIRPAGLLGQQGRDP